MSFLNLIKKYIFLSVMISINVLASNLTSFESGIKQFEYVDKDSFNLIYNTFQINESNLEYAYIDCDTPKSQWLQFSDENKHYIITRENFEKGIEILEGRGFGTMESMDKLFKTYGVRVQYYRTIENKYYPQYVNNVTAPKFCHIYNKAKELASRKLTVDNVEIILN